VGDGGVADKPACASSPSTSSIPPGTRGAGGTRAARRADDGHRPALRAHTKTKTASGATSRPKRKTEWTASRHAGEEGEAVGIAMPLTRRLSELIRDLEEGRRQMDWANLDPLVASRAGRARESPALGCRIR